jgi:polyhydroxyalkanoate synthesis regulator phasin
MSNDPIAFFAALREEDEALAEALAAIRAETDAGRITPAEAANERVDVLERHLAEVQRLRRELMGGS